MSTWHSLKWPDGSTYAHCRLFDVQKASTYEGLVEDERCQGSGVFRYGSGDRYEGEYQHNDMHGFGVYVWADGRLYRGQWEANKMNGCGVLLSKQPNGDIVAEEGQFAEDEWVGDAMRAQWRWRVRRRLKRMWRRREPERLSWAPASCSALALLRQSHSNGAGTEAQTQKA